MKNEGEMRKYDYGVKKNREIYDSDKPPRYDLGVWSRITKKPIIIYYGDNDLFSTIDDNLNLINLNKNGNLSSYEIPEYGHSSFI